MRKLLVIVLLVLVASSLAFIFWPRSTTPEVMDATAIEKTVETEAPQAEEAFQGKVVAVGKAFTVKVPNGWSASVSNKQSFLAIMFARPQKLNTLAYSPETPPTIDYNGIPSWGGLTEHFYIRSITAPAQQFKPSDHREVATPEPFVFDDGTVGEKYLILKHADEARAYGGFLKNDTEWQGRVYVYEKDNKRVESHIALYPSSGIDVEFYEKVVRTVSID